MPTILFTGGGSAGHVTPNLALVKKCQIEGWQVYYAGSKDGIEKTIISRINIPFFHISSGKLRRHLSWKNLLTPFQVIKGVIDAFLLCQKLKPNVVFSKGGYVAFPMVFSAWLHRIPVIAHESDLTPGLANRLSFPFAKKICVTFPEGKNYFKQSEKVIVTGTPLRPELLQGNAEAGRQFCEFDNNKKVLLIYGGGLGAANINKAICRLLFSLLEKFHIIHLCGKGKTDPQLNNINGYRQFEYINEELPDLLACADIVISRAGANSIYELLCLQKPHLLIPLSTKASRGDQIHNANYFANLGLSKVLLEENMTDEHLFQLIIQLEQEQEAIKAKLKQFVLPDSVEIIYNELSKIKVNLE